MEHQKLIIGKVSPELEEKAKENGFDIVGYQHDLNVSGTRHAIKKTRTTENRRTSGANRNN